LHTSPPHRAGVDDGVLYVQQREIDASKAEARREGFHFNKRTPEERRSIHAAKLGSMVGGTMGSATGGAAGSGCGVPRPNSAPARASPETGRRGLPPASAAPSAAAPSAADVAATKERVANRQAQSMEEMSRRAQALMWRPPS